MNTQQAAVRQLAPVSRPVTLLTYDQVQALEDISRRELFNRIKSGRYRAEPSGKTARNGRPINLIRLDTLSAEAQSRYLAQARDRADGVSVREIAEKTPAPSERLRGAAVPLTGDGTPDVAALRSAGRDTEAKVYMQRISAVSRAIARIETAPHGRKGKAWQQLAIELNTPAETLRCWIKQYRAGGAVALVPGYGHNRGHYSAIPEGLQKAILASYRTQQRQSVAQIMRHTVRPWCRTHGHIEPHRRTVSRFIDAETVAAERTAFRRGKRAWEEDIEAKVTRDPESMAVNSLWCADHRRMDTFVIAPDGVRLLRPWLTLYVDLASASFVGWCLRDRPTSQSVALALRSGILRRGAPKVLYHDNGKEFVAKRFGGKARRSHLQMQNPSDADIGDLRRWPAFAPTNIESAYGKAMLAQYGIERIINALPYSSWSKPIEAMFGAFAVQWENLMPGWCGNSPTARPEKLKRELAERSLLTWDQYVEIFERFVAEWDTNHVCGTRSKTPNQYYAAAREEIRVIPPESLDLLLLRSERKKIPPQGVMVGGKRFLDNQLAFHVGEYAEILWNPDDLSNIVVRPARNPNVRLVVSQIPYADWFEFSEANTIALSIRKQQRAQLRAVASADHENLHPDYVDPTGAFRAAAANAAEHRAANKERPSILAEMKAEKRKDKQIAAADESERKARASSAAAEILAQAKREEAYRNGEEPTDASA